MNKLLSFLMAVVLILSLAPAQLALEAHAENISFITLKKNDSTIAPGVTQTIATVRKSNNQQLVYYAMTVDTKVETAQIYANYKDNEWEPHINKQYGLQEVTKQMDAAVKNHTDPNSDRYVENYTVVGGINGTGYNMATGQTRGILVMEGHIVQEDKINSSGNPEPFFAIMKDGTPRIFWNENGSDWTNNKADIKEAIDSFVYPLIKNGEIVTTKTGDNNARTAIGITADKKVVMLVADGKQAASEGCDMGELAAILKEAGCVDAFNLDGGGSTTYVSRPEGESTYRVVNKPCDGSPRSVSASLMVVSTEAPSDKLNRVALEPENDYVTPGSTVKVDAVGLNSAGSVLNIPDSAVWKLADGSLGSVSGSGVFTSNGTTGDAVVQMEVDGKVMGETTIHVMQPDSVAFKQTQITVPFGKKGDIMIDVLSGVHSLAWKPEDFTFTVSDPKLGSVVGSQFAACEFSADAPTSGTITATLVSDPTLTATSSLILGRSSEVIENFESADALKYVSVGPNNYLCNYISEASLADASTGKVHGGSHSLAITFDLTQMADFGGHQNLEFVYHPEDTDATGLVGIGAWIWVPDEELITTIQQITWLAYYNGTEHQENQRFNWTTGENGYSGLSKDPNAPYGDGHWYYFYRNLDGQKLEYEKTCFNSFRLLFDYQIAQVGKNAKSQNNKLTFYLDDITIDYSSVVDDREAPVFGDVTLHPNAADNNVTMSKTGVTECAASTVAFSAAVSENTTKSNATGIDPNSAEALIDGVPVDAVWGNGILAVSGVTLMPGEHSLRLRIADNMGNYATTIRQFKITGDTKVPTVKLVPHDPTADRIPIGSVWYADVVASDASAIDGVELKLDLNNNCTWELDYADIDSEFEYSYSVYETENVASITLTRKSPAEGDTREGDVVLASLPIRTWEMNVPFTYYGGEGVVIGENDADRNGRALKEKLSTISGGEKEYELRRVTAEFMWSAGYLWASDISVEVDLGEITYAKGRVPDILPVFGGKVQVDTELFEEPAKVKAEYPEKTRWHAHTLGSPEDKDPDCMHAGYTGRVFCTVCKSPVTWGTTVPAAGHKWAIDENEESENAGKMCCSVCGKLFTGEINGTYYENGVSVDGWKSDGTYYKDGAKLGEGVHETEDAEGVKRYHSFGANGVCTDRETGYTGYCVSDANGVYKAVADLPENSNVLDTTDYFYTEAGIPYTGWLYFNKDGGAADKDDTKPANPEPDPDDPNADVGMPDDEQQQAILDMVAYHVLDGHVHRVETTDTRKCVVSGYLVYNCTKCDAKEQSERLWWVGHDWDIRADGTRKCKICQTEGKDISKATLNIMGENFEYTGGAIRAAVMVNHDGLQLSVRSDKNGLNGYVTYRDNISIGKATVIIDGVGDYYGQITGTFNIVPKSVKEVTKTETKGDDVNNVTVNLSWAPAAGASYYTVIRFDEEADEWIEVGPKVNGTSFSETLALGTNYYYRVASRGVGKDGDEVFYSVSWSDTVSGTIQHVWSEFVTDAAPTCTEDGSRTRTCSICGETETETLPKLGHDVAEWTTVKEPTIHETGLRTGYCERCEKDVEEIIPSLQPYSIIIASVENGEVTTDPADESSEGSVIEITATPDEGYELDKIEVTCENEDGETVSILVSDGKFTMPAADVTVNVSFSKIIYSYAVTVAETQNGTVTTDPAGEADEGSVVCVTTTPDSGYRLDKISATYTDGDGTHELEVNNGIFRMPSADVTVSASFTRVSTGSSGGGGGGGGASATTPSNTTTNADGSTTKTETKTDGTTVETTTNTDGSKVETETKTDGTKITTETDTKGNESKTVENTDGSKTVEVKQADGTTASATVSPDGKTEAEVKIPVAVVEQASGSNIALPIPEVKPGSSETAPTVKIDIPKTDTPVRVTVPVEDANASTVAVIVKADGSEEIVKKSVVTDDGLAVPLEEGATIKIVDNSKSFADVSDGNWAADAVSFASSRDLFQGVSDDMFAPSATMNRAMLVTVLHRLEGTPVGSELTFPDVKGDTWYSEAVAWASENNIVNGVGSGFDPDGSVSREQIAAILYRYAGTVGLDTAGRGRLDGFSDASSISDWAEDALGWAIDAGLFKGNDKNQLNPKGAATRAEVAVILQRFVEYMAS